MTRARSAPAGGPQTDADLAPQSLDALLPRTVERNDRGPGNGKQRLTPLAELLRNSRELTTTDRITWWEWRRAVGERIAARSLPDKLDAGTLLVTVKSSLWAQELSLHGPLIIERLRVKYPRLRTLRFRVGQVTVPELPAAKVIPQPAERLPDELERSLAQLDDEGLRDVIRTAASLSLGKR